MLFHAFLKTRLYKAQRGQLCNSVAPLFSSGERVDRESAQAVAEQQLVCSSTITILNTFLSFLSNNGYGIFLIRTSASQLIFSSLMSGTTVRSGGHRSKFRVFPKAAFNHKGEVW